MSGRDLSNIAEKLEVDELFAISGDLQAAIGDAPVSAPVKSATKHTLTATTFRQPKTQLFKRWVAAKIDDEADYGTAFLFLPVWFGCGALVYFSLQAEPAAQSIIIICALLFCIRVLARHTIWLKLVLSALLFGSLGFAAAQFETKRFATVMMGSEVTTRITGKLIHAEEITKGRTRLVIDVLATERPKLRFAPERIRVSARGNFSNIKAGSTVKGLVKLFALPGPIKPQGYDFAFESYFDRVGAAGFFLGKPDFAASNAPKTMAEKIDIMRSGLTAHIRSIVPGETGAVVAALVTGVRGAVSEEDNEALRRSGLAHIMSISGLHLALAAGVLIAAIRLGLALVPAVASRWPVKKMAAAAGITMAIAYCLLSGSEVATQRSTIMIAAMLGAVLVDRPAITMRNLAIAALILLAVWPHEIAGPGFQMSFAATASLIAIYRWWAQRPVVERPHADKLPMRIIFGVKNAIIGTVLSSTVAGLATLPFGAFHFERLAPWGTLSNLLALPAVSIVVMPSAVAAMVAMPLGLDGYIWPLMAWGVELMLWLAREIANLGGPDATGPVPLPTLLLATSSLVIFCLPHTGLRLFGIVPLLFALGVAAQREQPLMFIDENAKLVAFITGDGEEPGNRQLAVNTSRPDNFSLKNWQRTVRADGVVKPVIVDALSADYLPQPGFRCTDTICLAQLDDQARIAYVKDQNSIKQACGLADLVIQGFAGPEIQCAGNAAIITSGMLARHGSATLYKNRTGFLETLFGLPHLPQSLKAIGWRKPAVTYFETPLTNYRIEWSYPALNRPWQTQRVYSRAARDLAPTPKRKPQVFEGKGRQPRV